MTEVSPVASERARKTYLTVLQRLQEPGMGVALATAMGLSESAISRLKNGELETLCSMLIHLGLKVVPSSRVCVDRESYEAMTLIATKAMSNRDIAKQLIWEAE